MGRAYEPRSSSFPHIAIERRGSSTAALVCEALDRGFDPRLDYGVVAVGRDALGNDARPQDHAGHEESSGHPFVLVLRTKLRQQLMRAPLHGPIRSAWLSAPRVTASAARRSGWPRGPLRR